MSIARVQAVNNKGASVSSLATTITSSQPNSLLVISSRNTQTYTIVSVTDNQSNTWVQAPGAQNTGGGVTGDSVDTWYAANAIAGVTSITVTWNASGVIYVFIAEYSGVKTSSPLDTAGNNGQSNASPVVGPSMVSSTAGSVAVSSCFTDVGGVTGADSPWTEVITDANGNGFADYINTPATTVQCTFTDSSGSDTYNSTGAIFLAQPAVPPAAVASTFLVF